MVLYINKAYQTGTGRNVLCAVDLGHGSRRRKQRFGDVEVRVVF